ncbi:MAG: galactose mutarotase [Clostridiales bacterium]|nr:galactose mutarotase [Clostridiales bacterium]
MITKKLFDQYDGKDIYAYTISDGIEVTVCTLGATVLAIKVPNSSDEMTDVVLGMTNARDVIEKGDYMGAVVGRCANRIANGRFTLNGVEYFLAQNNGNAHLHGGIVGFNQKVFDASVDGNALTLTAISPDGEEGYSGNLTLTVRYTVHDSTLKIEYFAQSDKDTLFNPTNHAYFNLNGENDGSILDNYLQLNASHYLQIDKDLIPTTRCPVDGTPFDFRTLKPIGRDIGQDDPQLDIAGGYDHNFCLTAHHAALAYSPKTDIVMNVFTDMKGVQLYTGNFLSGNVGKSKYGKRSGFCLETQFYPNAINRDDCDKPILKAGEKFYSRTLFSFLCKKLNIG